MAARNVNKIKPWMNTNEIVNSYVQNIYKQMPISFNKGLRTCKVASIRPENRGPLSTWRNQQKQQPASSITPRLAAAKKSSSKMRQHANNVANFFKSVNQFSTNSTSTHLAANKRVNKTPNYKIYKTLRYGSSCSSSRSTIFKRYDDRKRQRQSNLAQINYLIRSFHTSKFEPTYARFLMPARNQQLETNLGSIPDALKFSNNLVKDLMRVDRSARDKVAQSPKNTLNLKPSSKRLSLEKWFHPPSLSKFKIKTPKGDGIKSSPSKAERSRSTAVLSPENRNYARLNMGRANQLKQARPGNEVFTPQHDRHKTELHEKHRRNRMKKLGLIKSSAPSEKSVDEQQIPSITENPNTTPKVIKRIRTPRLGNQTQSNILPPLLIEKNNVLEESSNIKKCPTNEAAESKCLSLLPTETTLKTVKNSCIPLPHKSNNSKVIYGKYSNLNTSAALPISYTTISPIVALRAQMPNKTDLSSYRYHHHDIFATHKY